MSDADADRGLRDRLTEKTEDRLGKALADLFDNSLVHGALGHASDARERAAQAQELAMGALNLPSAADIERLTRRLRSVSQRLEGIEDGMQRLGRTLSGQSLEARLGGIEEQLRSISGRLDARPAAAAPTATAGAAGRPTAKRSASAGAGTKRTAAKRSPAKRAQGPHSER